MTRPHLTIHRPSPTTALYTVSTASRRQTLLGKTLHFTLHTLRILTLLFILAALILKTLASSTEIPQPQSPIHSQPPRHFTVHAREYYIHLLQSTPWPTIIPPLLILLPLLLTRYHATESLLALRTLGIQTRTLSPSYLWPSNTRFIPTSQIRDIYIHEAFLGFEVRYYLAVVVEGEEEVVVVFPGLLPGREVVEEVWRGARGCLFEGGEKGEESERERGDD